MRKTVIIFLIISSGSILIYKGIDTINAIYFSILISGMLCYLYASLLEIKKAHFSKFGDRRSEQSKCSY